MPHFTYASDCVAVILPSLKKDKGTIPQDVRDAISEAVGKLDKVGRKRIMFVTTNVEPGDQQTLRECVLQAGGGHEVRG